MLRLNKQVFIALLNFSGLLASTAKVSWYTNYICLNNQPCMTRPTLMDLNPDECNQGMCCNLLMVNLDKCNEIYNTFDDLSSRICVPNITENVNINVFDMITRINESSALTKHISCKFKCQFDGRKCNSKQK